MLADLYLLEPCGAGNELPLLALEAIVLSARQVTDGHLELELELEGGTRIGAFGFTLGERASGLVAKSPSLAACARIATAAATPSSSSSK